MLGAGAGLLGSQANGIGFGDGRDHQIRHIDAQQTAAEFQLQRFAAPKINACRASKAPTQFGIEALQHDIHHGLHLGLGHAAVKGRAGLRLSTVANLQGVAHIAGCRR